MVLLNFVNDTVCGIELASLNRGSKLQTRGIELEWFVGNTSRKMRINRFSQSFFFGIVKLTTRKRYASVAHSQSRARKMLQKPKHAVLCIDR